MSLADKLKQDSNAALRAGDKPRLGALRMALAAVKQREVDSRETQTDAQILAVIEKLIKQGRDAATQFSQAGREDLAAKETREIEVLSAYLPEPLTAEALDALVAEVIADTGASSTRDMGRIMAEIKTRAAGRVDMAAVSPLVRGKLGTG